ncbi:PTS fructose transporter subunit IIA [Bombilactobacillus bombi]|uniref:PTS fructose transporter subunit IIA n=1 Tax=Bombilactobacillus bombi TaxID=1303590 RepID=A0A417ZC79_9LACO|nr:fructose-specific PTS transporter subunit EIIC [Bombilactobacillus bombi]RHW48224.1 PTS fructose transporter subunit IIA [Bombilactobacillus bombi]
MDIRDLIDINNILISVKPMSKKEAINQLVNLLDSNNYLTNVSDFRDAINKRENEISTAVGYGVAIPHGKSVGVTKPTIAILRNLNGIKWETETVNLVFMIAAPQNASDEHLKMLSKISTFLMDETFRAKLLTAVNIDQIYKILIQKDYQQNNQNNQKANINNIKKYQGKQLVGISACMTGIAHTFMAASALESAAKQFGMKVKIQTNGSTGIENKLTSIDVKNADAIVVAHDVKVNTSIFGTRNILDIPVKRAIDSPESVVQQAMEQSNKETSNLISEKNNTEHETKDSSNNTFAHEFYTHIMSGVSYMIPFVVVGGIFIAISFMFGIYASDPKSNQYNIWAAFFNEMGGNSAFKLYVPVLAAYISWSIADKPGLAPGMICGMMAMNGGSGFLGGMLAGFLGGYVTKLITHKTRKIPHTYQGLISVLLVPLAATFIVGFVMFFILNTPMSIFNKFLTNWLKSMNGTNAALIGAILAGMMASDMGGPINKTASAFGLAMFASKVYGPSAALMVGGMVPPLGVAIATILFKNKFTLQEREAGKANWILGACFITEGAIPFAAADPLRVIPANIIGGAIGGSLSMLFNITLQAPHGGIFVIPVACNKPIIYIGCIIIGAIITALIMGLSKKVLTKNEINKKMSAGII